MSNWPPPPQEPDPPPSAPPQHDQYPPGPPPGPPPQPPQYGQYQQQYQQYPQYPLPGYQQAGYNGLAIASMILGILWLYWVGSILALIFGYVAKGQIRERGQQGSGFATAGIVLGWIGAATLALTIVIVIISAATGGFDSSVEVIRPGR